MKRSIYSKMFYVLQVALSTPDESGVSDLIANIESKQSDIFTRLVYNEAEDRMEALQSRRTIKKAIRCAQLFGLLDDEGRPTKVGKRAQAEREFTKAMRVAVITKLEEAGTSVDKLNRTVQKTFGSRGEALPTAAALYELLGPSLSKQTFVFYLSILQDCGAAEVCHKKLFLKFI